MQRRVPGCVQRDRVPCERPVQVMVSGRASVQFRLCVRAGLSDDPLQSVLRRRRCLRAGLRGRMLTCLVPGKLLQHYKVSCDSAAMRSAVRREPVRSGLP